MTMPMTNSTAYLINEEYYDCDYYYDYAYD